MRFGSIQDIRKIGEIAKRNNIYFHTDAVQAIGNLKIDVERDNIDMLSMSAHKFYGPKGVRSIICKIWCRIYQNARSEDIKKKIKEQEQKMQQKLQGFGSAIELAYKNIDKYNQKLTTLREYYISNVEKRIKDIKINGDRNNRLPGNANISFKGVDRKFFTFKIR